MPNLIGQTVGQYRILEQIGRGGMATVYKAYQPSMERNVALKVLPAQLAQDPTFLERFRQEAKAIAQLEHPHILPVYDYGETEGLTYLVMRYMDSGTLTTRLRKPIDLADVVRLLGQVAEALDYTHSRGIVHRDIKPSNVLIDPRGEALLTDFGIAKVVEGVQGMTQGGIIGTPKYMSPEQAQGRPVDGRSDIYSLGVILYEALVGRPPFEAETPVAVLMKHVNDPLPLPRSLAPQIDEAMERVILKTLAKDPADRYQTAGEMERAMQAALATAGQGLTYLSLPPEVAATSAAPPLAIPPASRSNNRLPLIIGGVVVLVALLIGGWALGLFGGSGETPTAAVAETTATSVAVAPVETEPTPTPVESSASEATLSETPPVPAATATLSPPPSDTPTPAQPTATSVPVATVAPALPPTPTPVEALAAINVTSNPGKSDNPRLAVDGAGILHLVWWDNSTGKTSGDFLHRQMTPDGQWSEAEILSVDFEIIISHNSRLMPNPAGQICAFWWGAINQRNPATGGLYMRCQIEGSWSAAEMILQGRGNMRDFTPVFAPDGTVHTLYLIGAGDLFFEDFELSDGFKTAYQPDFAIDQAGGYHAVWVRQGDPFSIEHRYSTEGGQTWLEAERLTDEETSAGGTVSPLRLIADRQGNVHLVFVSQNRGIFYRRWLPDAGWGPPVELMQGAGGSNSTGIGLAVDATGLPHVFWHGLQGAFYTQMLEDETWSKPRLITDMINSGMWPDIAVDKQGVRHFVWQAAGDALDLYYATLPKE